MVCWLVQLAALTMMACFNVWWQGSKLKQSKMDGGAQYVNLWGKVYTPIQLFIVHHRN